MGISTQAVLICDKDKITTINLDSPDAPLPDGWLRVQGYANINNVLSTSLLGYFCPTCVQTYGTRQLSKDTCDMCLDLTDPS